MLSKWRSAIPVYGMSPSLTTVRQMQLYYGVTPIWAKRAATSDDLIESSIAILKSKGHLETDDLVVMTAGVIPNKSECKQAGYTNIMQVEVVK